MHLVVFIIRIYMYAVHLNLPVDLGDEKCRHMIYNVCAEYKEWLEVFSAQNYEMITDWKLQ